ncbi:MAG: sulfatase-like hydrolase/transferase [Verrucomicrobiota bacterium JB024]|nr:sulfatase-like hydrolase/transferase [Verrucomicrobiota bacterium JB024]
MDRRNFLQVLVAGGLISLTPRVARSAMKKVSSAETPPNILWIMTDQQFAGAMSCAGDADLKTPAMDWIAARGVRFEQAYCTNPICVPSRSSMITGKYPHEVDVSTNFTTRNIIAPSLGTLMHEAGYRTGYVGKWHIPVSSDNQAWHGFDYTDLTKTKGPDPQIFQGCEGFFAGQSSEKPWFLVASYLNPHDICEWARMESGIDDTLPNGPIPEAPDMEDCPTLPDNFGIPEREPSVIRELQNNPAAHRTYPTQDWDEKSWRQYRWAYNRLIEKADADIGKLLHYMEQKGLLENTVIIFTSDHGDGMGAHQWNQKTLFYEESARVPFIIAGKGVAAPGRTDEATLVSTGIDLAPTILDYAGAPLPAAYFGLSQRAAAEDRTAPGHAYIVSENDLAPKYNQTGGVYGRMLRTPQYKYVIYSEGEDPEQLFDLSKDPGEMHNLAYEEAYVSVLEEHRALLREHLKKTNDPFVAEAL